MKSPLISLLPEGVRPLLSSIPSIAFSQVPWKDLIKSVRSTASVYINNDIPEESIESIQSAIKRKVRLGPTSDESEGKFGDQALYVYFSQLASEKGMFLDLRKGSFSSEGSETIWSPKPIFHKFQPAFRNGLVDLYQGYYLKRDEQFDSAIKAIGLVRPNNESDTNKVKDLLFSHFGKSQEKVKFDLDVFTKSFTALFEYIQESKIEVPVDFAYLGIYLASLYMHLSNCDEPFDVRAAFLNSEIGS